MFFCTDVHYDEDRDAALAAAVGFWRSDDDAPTRRFVEPVQGIQPYEPGAFYRRELPCLLAVLHRAARVEPLDLVLVDGHAWLRAGEPGLGHHLWRALGEGVPVVGVAKAPFAGGCARPVLRAGSTRPLYVSSVGLPDHEAAAFVQRMHGVNRLPTMIAEADALCRGR